MTVVPCRYKKEVHYNAFCYHAPCSSLKSFGFYLNFENCIVKRLQQNGLQILILLQPFRIWHIVFLKAQH